MNWLILCGLFLNITQIRLTKYLMQAPFKKKFLNILFLQQEWSRPSLNAFLLILKNNFCIRGAINEGFEGKPWVMLAWNMIL